MPSIRVTRLLPAIVAAMALLFAVLQPPASRMLAFPAALGFWVLHIGIGMLLAIQATGWLSRVSWFTGWNPWARLLAAGLVGSVLFAPVALALEWVLPIDTSGESPDDVMDAWEANGGPLALLAEWLQLLPSYLAAWMLVNAGLLAASGPQGMPVPARAAPAPAPGEVAVPTLIATPVSAPVLDPTPAAVGTPASAPDAAAATAATPALGAIAAAPMVTPIAPPADQAPADAGFIALLPPAIGTDLIAIQADLHYLQVRTARGRATVLATIATAERALGELGLRVHRSHWVSLRHVARLARTARGNVLILSDGSRVPVSRRRAAEVQARLGRDFVVDPAERL